MNAKVSSLAAAVAANRPSHDVATDDAGAALTVSDQLSARYDRASQALWVEWAPRGVPCFNVDLLLDLERASRIVEGFFFGRESDRPLRHIVLKSANSAAFSVGGDLGYFREMIVSKDRARLAEYARSAVNVIYNNYTAHNLRNVTTIALLEGDALGGGFECALSCDLIVAESHAKAGFPEILFNMFPGMGGMSFLARRVSRSVAEEMVRSGRQYTASELLGLGLVDQVVDRGRGRDAIEALMEKREHQAAGHSAMNAADRLIRPIARQELYEVANLWVDCALHLPERGLEWMQRLYRRQRAVFEAQRIEMTRPTEVVVSVAAA